MKKKAIAFATSPARTCGVVRNERGRSAMPFFCSTRPSTFTSTPSTTMPSAASGSAGEMPKMVNGQPASGSTSPHDEIPERPMRKRKSPVAARATPAPSNTRCSLSCSMRGSSSENAKTSRK